MVVRPYFTEQKKVLPFEKVIELETIDDVTFRSITKAYSPTGGDNGTYGGHVYAQSAWAAAQTVAEGFFIHNITGFFLLGGKPNEHYTYKVQKLRDGYNYCTRSVAATQIESQGPMFTCTISFKRDENSPVNEQRDTGHIKETYREILEGKEHEPMLHDVAPSIDSKHFLETYLPAHPEHFNPIAGIHLRRPVMTKYNESRKPLDRRQLTFYTARGSFPLPTAPYPPPPQEPKSKNKDLMTVTREANMHAAAHLYASDRNSLFVVPNHLGRPRSWTRLASLAHSVIFHVGIRDLALPSEPRIDHPNADPTFWEDGATPLCNVQGSVEGETDADGRKWYVQESWFERAAEGRAMHASRLWDYERGVHVASTYQDGLIRFEEGEGAGRGKL